MGRFVAVVAGCLAIAACGASNVPTTPSPSIPSRPVTSSSPVIAADLAACLRGLVDASCFSALRLTTRVVAAATAPSAPTNLVATVSGSSVMLAWSAPSTGDPVTTYVIEAGSTSGAADLANLATNSTTTIFSAAGVPAGTYFVRVRAQSAAAVSAPSNETIVIVGGSTACPGPPTNLTVVSNSNGSIVLAWAAASGSPTSYLIEAGSASALTNLANIDLGSSATAFSTAGVPVGTYYVRIRARNGCGTSAPSNEIVLTVFSNPQVFTDSVLPLSYTAHYFTLPTTGPMTILLSWANAFVDLDLYLTRSTCRGQTPTGCPILESSATLGPFERITWSAQAGESYGIWIYNFNFLTRLYTVTVTYPAAIRTEATAQAAFAAHF